MRVLCVTRPGMDSYDVWRCTLVVDKSSLEATGSFAALLEILLLLLGVDRMLETGPHCCTLYPVFTLPRPSCYNHLLPSILTDAQISGHSVVS